MVKLRPEVSFFAKCGLPWSCEWTAGAGNGSGSKFGIRGNGVYSVRVADAGRLIGYLMKSSGMCMRRTIRSAC